MVRWLCVGCLLVCGAACRNRHEVERATPTAVENAQRAAATVEPLGAPDAFDLVATSDGAVLVWVGSRVCERGLSVLRLDADGRVQASSEPGRIHACLTAANARIQELALAAGGGKLGVVWIEDGPKTSQLVGTYANDSGSAFAAPTRLGSVEPQLRRPRSRLWLVASETGQMRVAWHAPRARCVGESGTCTQLISQAHPPQAGAAERRTDVREIPEPCTRFIVGSIWTNGTWYDAFCAFDATGEHAVTHVYAIRPDIYYAQADPVLTDCEPLGLSPTRAGAVAWGRCDDGLRARTVAPEGQRQLLVQATTSVTCDAGRPILHVRGRAGQEASLALNAPLARLEQWLPDTLGGTGSRAVFTGRRLVVATAHEGRLQVRAMYCQSHGLVSEPPSML